MARQSRVCSFVQNDILVTLIFLGAIKVFNHFLKLLEWGLVLVGIFGFYM
jgi:hypothetical protein